MKRRKIFLISLITIGVVLLTTVSSILINGHYFKLKEDLKDYKNNNWMSYLKDDIKIIDVVIPGSHDAGASDMTYLGRTQGYDIEKQLEMGCRYFDLRVNKEEDNYYLYHAYFNGEEFIDALSDLTDFIKENTSETLILDFQHFKGNSENDVIKLIDQYLLKDNLVISNNSNLNDLEYISNLTLKESRGKCIVLFGNEELANEYNYLFSRNNDECIKKSQVLNSYYYGDYHKMSSKAFINEALPLYYQNIKNKIEEENYKGLFVLQGQLTDGQLIFGPYSKEKTHDENMSRYIKNIALDKERLELTNIIMRDFLTYSKCENIIALNYFKNNLNEENKNEFKVEYYDYIF